jgi:hypothetical protein
MPYIKYERRKQLAKKDLIRSSGELNYLLTDICLHYLDCSKTIRGKITYCDYNAVIGALECCKQEFYRRIIAPYEDIKIKENGDVY